MQLSLRNKRFNDYIKDSMPATLFYVNKSRVQHFLDTVKFPHDFIIYWIAV